MTREQSVRGCALILTALIGGCGGGDSSPFTPFEDIYQAGLTRYVGSFSPTNDPVENQDGVKQFTFSGNDRGPRCLRGGEFFVETREGASDNLLIYLQGGGACFEAVCAAFPDAIPFTPLGILDSTDDENPFQDFDVVYVPYCDGSLFAGDVDRVVGGAMGFQRGIQNLSAAFDVAIEEFPAPARVVLAGVSAGGYGTITATPLTRFFYPEEDFTVLNDSGPGIARPGEPDFVNGLLDEFNIEFLPESCVDCTADGHLTGLIAWALDHDPSLRMGLISHDQDSVIRGFLSLDEEEFRTTLLSETGELNTLFPDRYKRFILNGTTHTTLLGGLDLETNNTTVRTWVNALLNSPPDWGDTLPL